MDAIVKVFTDHLFTEAGFAGVLMALAIVYLLRELGREKKDHAETRKQLMALSEKSITSSVQSTEAMAAMRAILEVIRGLLSGRAPQ